MSSTTPPILVLSSAQARPLLTVDAHVLWLHSAQDAGALLPLLARVAPLGALNHCKRIRKDRAAGSRLCVLLCAASAPEGESTVELDWNHWTSLGLARSLGDLAVLKVPAHEPLTRVQFEASNLIWPVLFHEDKHVSAAQNGTLFSSAALDSMQKFMRMAVAVAAAQESTAGAFKIGAVLVDGNTGAVVARGCDERTRHPLRHAAMVAIEAAGIAHRESQLDGYLCKDLDVYLTHEPCVMFVAVVDGARASFWLTAIGRCCMALVHSRIRRLFFGLAASPRTTSGAVTARRIHVNPSLNHKFEAFGNLSVPECMALNATANVRDDDAI